MPDFCDDVLVYQHPTSRIFISPWRVNNSKWFFQTVLTIWQPYFWGSAVAWKIILVFTVFELALMRILPGKTFNGPITPKGNVPVYKDNGVLAFIVTMATFALPLLVSIYFRRLFFMTI